MRYDWKIIRPALRRAVLRVGVLISVLGGGVALFHPETPLPDEWNPTKPLQVNASVTALTSWKLRAALRRDDACFAALEQVAHVSRMPPLFDSEECHIQPRLAISSLGDATLAAFETRCQTALRLAMWEQHGLQTAARRHLGREVIEIRHYSSYSCRKMRTSAGESDRMSSHATANAIDVSGFRLADGTLVDLRRDWPGEDAKSAFLRDAFESACIWFPLALGPDYNNLHADHFHLQATGWGLCR